MLGKMRHRVRIEKRTRSGDGMGGAGSTWELDQIVWAYVRPKQSTESTGRDRIEERKTYLFTVRYRSDLTAAKRLVFENENYNIVTVKNIDERDKYMELEAVVGTVA